MKKIIKRIESPEEKVIRKRVLSRVMREWEKTKYIIESDDIGGYSDDIAGFTLFLNGYKNLK